MPNALLRRLCHSRASCSHLLGLATAAQAAPRRRPKHGAGMATSCQGSRYHGDAFPTVSSPQNFPPLPPSWPGSSSTSQPGMRVRRSSCGDLSPVGPRQVAILFPLKKPCFSFTSSHLFLHRCLLLCVFTHLVDPSILSLLLEQGLAFASRLFQPLSVIYLFPVWRIRTATTRKRNRR